MSAANPDESGVPLAALHQLCATTASAFREGHKMAEGSQEQSEKALVWLTGLMGAGIFSVLGLLVAAPLWVRLTGILPWTLGILSAIAGQLLGAQLRNGNNLQHHKRISTLELLQLETDRVLILRNLRPLIEAGTSPDDVDSRTLSRLRVVTNWAFYLAYALVAVGVVAAVIAVTIAGKVGKS